MNRELRLKASHLLYLVLLRQERHLAMPSTRFETRAAVKCITDQSLMTFLGSEGMQLAQNHAHEQ